MVHLVLSDNRDLYSEALAAMYRDRKRTFVDRLKWDVPVVDGEFEMDQFDTADAIYLLALDPVTQAHLGSVRLLPTTRPYLLGSVFPHLCEGEPPVGDDVWEITRMCTTPGLDKHTAMVTRWRMKMAFVEFALLYGINRYVLMTHMSYLSALLAQSWHAEPLGLPKDVDGQLVGALQIHITPETLRVFRDEAGTRHPILQCIFERRAAA